jgi:hypothetical protein
MEELGIGFEVPTALIMNMTPCNQVHVQDTPCEDHDSTFKVENDIKQETSNNYYTALSLVSPSSG